MPYGTCCNGASSVTVRFHAAVFRATWSIPNAYGRWKTPWLLRKSTAWTAAYCSPPAPRHQHRPAILVRIPGHMYVGYYTDRSHNQANFLETTMIGDMDLDDFFPRRKTGFHFRRQVAGRKCRGSLSRNPKSMPVVKYSADSARIQTLPRQYMFLEISKALRRKIQPLGK